MVSQTAKGTEGFQPRGKGVLITGCSSGIGRATALYLARQGFTVFATVRKERDAEALRQLKEPDLVPVCPLDLTRLDHIPDVLETVKSELAARGSTGLYAVINNAGGGEFGPLELLDLEDFRQQLEARILGPVALLQAFLPLLREGQGRVLWIATPGLLPIPYVASIHACDFAVNCLARTLELELKPWNIASILIRCGGIKRDARSTSSEPKDPFLHWPEERRRLYASALAREEEELSEFDKSRTEKEEVAKVIFQALSARKPKRRYRIGHLAGLSATLELLPQTVVDFLMARRWSIV